MLDLLRVILWQDLFYDVHNFLFSYTVLWFYIDLSILQRAVRRFENSKGVVGEIMIITLLIKIGLFFFSNLRGALCVEINGALRGHFLGIKMQH